MGQNRQQPGKVYAAYERPTKTPSGNWSVIGGFCAGFLICKGHWIVAVEPAVGSSDKFVFVFSPAERFEADVNTWEQNGTVPILDFVYGMHVIDRLIRRAKSRLRSQQARESLGAGRRAG